MGQPAARLTDLTTHGSPLAPGPGCTSVLIGSLPAFRAQVDTHTCPLASPNPHGAGTVVMGSPRVLVGGSPLVRMGDSVMEAGGGPNTIVSGCLTVLVG